MTPEQKVRDALIRVRQRVNEPGFTSIYGICAEHAALLDPSMSFTDADKLLTKGFQKWPEYSGDLFFPVPGPEGQNPGDAYEDTWCKWSGPYGDARRRLLDFLIQHFEEVTQCQSGT